MSIKQFLVALALALGLAACGASAETVARLDGVTLSRQELDRRVERIEEGIAAQAIEGVPAPSRSEIEQQVVGQFIDQQLVLGLARQRGIAVSDEEINSQIENFRTQIGQATGGTLDEAVQQQLGLPGESSSEFRQFVSFFVARQKLGEELVDPEALRSRITEEVTAETQRMVDVATVAHILVNTEEEARAVLERLDNGEAFEDLAAELSQDPGSAQNGGVYENIQRGQFVPEFEQAMFETLEPGETTADPVQTQFGWHVIRLISRDTAPALPADQAEEMIESRVQQELSFEQQRAVQELIDAERQKAIDEQRLVEPVFPTPTAEPLPTIAPLPEEAPAADATPTPAP